MYLVAISEQAIVTCKSKEKSAYNICCSKLAKNKQERLVCLLVYLKHFPDCYFRGTKTKKTCTDDVLQSFAKCVMESQSVEEIVACNKRKEETRILCRAALSTRGAERNDNQICNECKGDYDKCHATVEEENEYQECLNVFNSTLCKGCVISRDSPSNKTR